MREDRSQAEQLRRKGKSYKYISRELGIPISTLAEWFKREAWSMEIRDRLASTSSLAHPDKLKKIIAVIKAKHADLHESYRKEAVDDYKILRNNPLFTLGLGIYWGEGDKSVKYPSIRLNNSDPVMIRIFCKFLGVIMGVPKAKIRIYLLLYPDLLEEPSKRFWSAAIGIPLSQFRKSVFIKGRHSRRRLSYGVGNIYVGGRKYKEKMNKWIEMCKEEFIR